MNHPTRQLRELAAHFRTVIGVLFSVPFTKSAVIYAKCLPLLATAPDPGPFLASVSNLISV